jgi:ABC-type multidrug transport system ATPase subunit
MVFSMNETVINLAIQTIAILKTAVQEKPEFPEAGIIFQYFGKLGVNSEDINQVYQHYRSLKTAPGRSISDSLCQEINTMLHFNEKIYLLLLVQDCLLKMHDKEGFKEQLDLLYKGIGIDSLLIDRFRVFLEHEDPALIESAEYLLLSPLETSRDEILEGRWIESNAPRQRENYSIFEAEGFKGYILVMFVDQIKSYVIRCMMHPGQYFDEETRLQCRFRLIEPGNELSLKGVSVLTYSELKSRFLQFQEKKALSLVADQVQYKSSGGKKEVSSFITSETTGQLIGIVGKEGVGKSTLLKLLAGKIKPDTGTIYINGYDLWKNKYLLKGTIGYVPEEDLLYEELTVSDNLTLTARMYYSHLSARELDARVNSVLSRLDLLELKHVVVGGILSKHIQPGQRRMINIALELLREPQILLVDNALSGLGMADAAKVIKILHDYSFKGNLVITTISQADSITFRFFDKIWILDEGGVAVYNGSVKGAYGYLSKNLKLAYQEIQDVDPSQLLDLVNYKLPDKEGHVWKRVCEPKDWHDLYLREMVLKQDASVTKTMLPARMLKIPNLEVQFLIFSIRNFKCKFSRLNDIIRTLITGPAIALLIGFAFRTKVQDTYNYSANDNIPLYLFLSVVVAIFLGLVLSAGEILRERNMLEKEEYLEFSRFSYINSKIMYLFPVIALQTFLYVLTGNLILGIHNMIWFYWLVLFSVACFGVLFGLTCSGSVQNADVLYKRILPFVIALQLILGGGIIPYERMNIGSGRYTPILADFMVARWGYEALAVKEFTDNKFERMVYDADKNLSHLSYYSSLLIPKLQETLISCLRTNDEDSVKLYTGLLKNEMLKIKSSPDIFPFEFVNDIDNIKKKENVAVETHDYLTYLSLRFYDQYQKASEKKRILLDSLNNTLGKKNLVLLHRDNFNYALENIVTNKHSGIPYMRIGSELVRTQDNIYEEPVSNLGRARLFSPKKLLNNQKTDTLWFNISVIWVFTAVCYLLLLFNAAALVRRITPKFNRRDINAGV